MSPQLGRQGFVGLVKESTRGTKIDTPTYWVPGLITGGDVAEYVQDEGADGSINMYSHSSLDKLHAEPAWEGTVHADSIGLELLGVFGSHTVVTVSGQTSLYDHTFDFDYDSNQHQSFTVADQNDPDSLRYALSVVNTFNMSMGLGAYLQRSIAFMSRVSETVTKVATNTIDVDSSERFRSTNASVKLASAGTTNFSSADSINCTEFSLDINKNAVATWAQGSTAPLYITNGGLTAEASITLHYVNKAQKDKVLAGTNQAMEIKVDNGLTGADQRSLSIVFENVTMQDFARNNGANDLLTQTIKIMPFRSGRSSSSRLARAILRNGVATY